MDLLVNEFLGPAARHEIDLAAALDLRDLLIERTPRRQARAMREQMAKGNVTLAINAKIVKKARQPIVETHLRVPRQHHHGDRRCQWLGQGREVENGLETHWRRIRYQRAEAKSALIRDIATDTHHQRCPWYRAFFNRLREGGFNLMPTQAASPSLASSIHAFTNIFVISPSGDCFTTQALLANLRMLRCRSTDGRLRYHQ